MATYGRGAMDIAENGPSAIEADDRLRWALERTLYLVGEAARALSPSVRESMDQPWQRIIGLRTILAHRYQDVDTQTLVDIAQKHLPSLIDAVQSHLD